MPLTLPTTATLAANFLAEFESALNQNAPQVDKSFLRVEAAAEAAIVSLLLKYGAERSGEALALTASETGLATIGENYGVIRDPATAATITADLPADNGTNIPAQTEFTGSSNGVRYLTTGLVVAAGDVAALTLTARDAGQVGNLPIDDTLTIGNQIAGAGTTATVTGTTTTGADAQALESYRAEVLAETRSQGGGGNTADYKRWAEEAPGTVRAFPYSGQPYPTVGDPGDRTVYIESATETDGIPTSDQLDEARQYINYEPPGFTVLRPPLGEIDDTLWVEAISRTEFWVRVTDLVVSADQEAATKADLDTALAAYFLSASPFVDGLTAPAERNDSITEVSVSEIVQDVLSTHGASATRVEFSNTSSTGPFINVDYVLNPGELAKLSASSGVTYV